MNVEEMASSKSNTKKASPRHVTEKRAQVMSDPETLQFWKEAGVVSNAGGEVVTLEVPLDVRWSDLVSRLMQITEEMGGVCEAAGSSDLRCFRNVSAGDFRKVGVAWKRRDGAAGLLSSTNTESVWVRRVVALTFGASLRYFGEDDVAKVGDWERPRGEIDDLRGATLRFANEHSSVLGAPTGYVVQIEQDAVFWLLCFESPDESEAWRLALREVFASPTNNNAGGDASSSDLSSSSSVTKKKTPPSFDYVARATTSLATTARRTRHLVLEARRRRPSWERSAESAVEAADASADVAFADRLANKERGLLSLPLLDVDARVVHEFRVAAAVAVQRRHTAAVRDARARIAEAQALADKTTALVKAAYAKAKLMLPELVLSPPLSEKEDSSQDDDHDETVAREGAEALRDGGDEQRVVDHCFSSDSSDVGAACRASRRALAARAASDAADRVQRSSARRLAAKLEALEAHVSSQLARAATHKATLCSAFDRAVAVDNAWPGADSPTAKLWTAREDAAKAKSPALVALAATNSLVPGTLFVGTKALYFEASSNSVLTAVLSASSRKNKKGGVDIPLAAVTALSRVPSPVPLKKNALKVLLGTDSAVFTLSTPGASVSALLDLIQACKRVLDGGAGKHEKSGVFSPSASSSSSAAATTTSQLGHGEGGDGHLLQETKTPPRTASFLLNEGADEQNFSSVVEPPPPPGGVDDDEDDVLQI